MRWAALVFREGDVMEDRLDAYVRYRDDVEVRRPDEDRVTAEIIDAMRRTAASSRTP
jgi:hypothetical protein